MLKKQLKTSIANSFARGDRSEASRQVSCFIDDYRGREIERVLRVVLAMADGDLTSLADAIRLAQGDYRDILALEGFTGSGALRSDPARALLQEQFSEYGMAIPKGMR